MTTAHENTPTVAPTTTGAAEKLAHGISPRNSTPRPIALHLPHNRAGQLSTWGGCDLAPKSIRSVFIDATDYLDLCDQAHPAQLCPACVDSAVAHSEEEKRKQEERLRRQKQAEEAQERRSREEGMRYELVDAYRAGDTAKVTRLLDELLAEDDAALAELGISSWDEVGGDE